MVVGGAERTGGFFFACAAHQICHSCDARMRAADDRRCPICRAPRLGLTVEEAEPAADRNAPSPVPFGDLRSAFHWFVESGAQPQLAAGLPTRARVRSGRGRGLTGAYGGYGGVGLGGPVYFPAEGILDLRPTQQRAPAIDADEILRARDALHELATSARRQARRLEFAAAAMDPPADMDALASELADRARAHAAGAEADVGLGSVHEAARAMLAELCSGAPLSVAHWRALHRRARGGGAPARA